MRLLNILYANIDFGGHGTAIHYEGSVEAVSVHIRAIRRRDKAGKIGRVRTVGGKRRVPESEIKRILEEREIIGYAGVSSHTQKDSLERQAELVKSYAEERNWEVEILKDVGSG